MTAIRDSEASRVWYQYCQNINRGRINMVYHNAGVDLMGCFARESQTKGIYAMLKQIKAIDAAGGPEKSCVADLKSRAYREHSETNEQMLERSQALQSARDEGLAAYDPQSIFKPLDE